MKPLYQESASLVDARLRCIETGNNEWKVKHEERLIALCKEYMPSGSGIDCGTKIDLDASTPDKLVFYAPYHHMNDGGMYDGWTDHSFTVTPSLQFGYRLKIGGRDRNNIKEYLHDVFSTALDSADIKSPVPA